MPIATIPHNVLPSLIAPSRGAGRTGNRQPRAVPLHLVNIANRTTPVARPTKVFDQAALRTPTVADMRRQWETRELIAPAPTPHAASAATAQDRATATARAGAGTLSITARLAKFNPVRLLAEVLRKVHNPASERDTATVVEAINPVVAQRWQPTLLSATQARGDAPGIFADGGNEWEDWDDAVYTAEEQQAFDERFKREDRQMAALGQTPANVPTHGNEWEDWHDAVYTAEEQQAFDKRFEQEDRQMAALDSPASSKPPIGPKPHFIDGVWRSTSPPTR